MAGTPHGVTDRVVAGANARVQSAVRNQALDGIRGFAALAVLFAHFVVFMGLLPYQPLGAMGVLMFFALSGYLIGGMCWRAPPTLSAYRAFLKRRVVRLAPVVLALVTLGGPALVLVGRLPAGDVARTASSPWRRGPPSRWR